MEEDDFDDEYYSEEEGPDEELLEAERLSIMETISSFNEAYELVKNVGKKSVVGVEEETLVNAFNRMLGYFVYNEEFEKCARLRNFAKDNFIDGKVEPDFRVIKELKLDE